MTRTSEAAVPPPAHPLLPGASPATIRSYLLPEDRSAFADAYGAALDEARRTWELAPLHDVIEQWRRVAVVQSDPARFRRTARRAAEFFTGEPSPEDEPFEVTRSKAGM
ncbi:DUF6247 family protein [Actinomycetospora sp. OC33-EN08]|uniref:DUF6247 family protein n=1 Tax=Actinomycetospora aurantiaca TaxID=3129233 RepID=A0ABU8MHE6_9PSEU